MSTKTGRETAGSSRLPARARDRRPALAALALLLIVLGALGSALIAYRSGDRVEVLVAARPIEVGDQVTEQDFGRARIAYEGGQVVEADSVDAFIDAFATSRIPEGAMLAPQMFTTDDISAPGGERVGLTLEASRRPSQPLERSDVVEVFFVPTEGEQAEAETVVEAARVVDVADIAQGSDSVHITVLVPESEARAVAQYAANGRVAVALLPADTEPAIDLRIE